MTSVTPRERQIIDMIVDRNKKGYGDSNGWAEAALRQIWTQAGFAELASLTLSFQNGSTKPMADLFTSEVHSYPIYYDLHLAALDLVRDQHLLIKLARVAQDRQVRERAFERLKDPAVILKSIEEMDHGPFRARLIAEKISNPEALCRIAMNRSEAVDTWKIIRRLENHETQLIELAERAPQESVRIGAIVYLKNQLVLERIANESEYQVVRESARERLADLERDAFARLDLDTVKELHQRGDGYGQFASISLPRRIHTLSVKNIIELKDSGEILAALKAEPDQWVRLEVIHQTTDPSVLRHFAVHDTSHYIRSHIATKLEDLDTLVHLARYDSSARVRSNAIPRVRDSAILFRIANDDPDLLNRRIAARSLSIRTKYPDIIALRHPDPEVRDEAVERVRSQRTLARIALRDVSDEVRRRAIRQLTDHWLLAEVAISVKDPTMRTYVRDRMGHIDTVAYLDSKGRRLVIKLVAFFRRRLPMRK